MGWITEKPNRYPIIFKTETDTDFGILKTGKYRIPTKNNRKDRFSRLFSCLLKPFLTLLPMFYNAVECATMEICVGCVKLFAVRSRALFL